MQTIFKRNNSIREVRNMQVIISHPTSNEFNRAAVKGLLEAGVLSEFHTTLALFPDSFIDYLSKLRPFSEIHRRSFDPVLKEVIKSKPWFELGRQVALRTGVNSLVNHETGFFSVDAVYRNLDKHVSNHLKGIRLTGKDTVYAYEDGALHSFRGAKKQHMRCLYDLPIGYWRTARKLLAKEKERWPEWAATIKGFDDSETKLRRKDEELQLADQIFVASSFTAKTLKDYPGKLAPVHVIPYGFPKVTNQSNNFSFAKNRKLKLLFVGGLSQRKGIADLFAAVEALKEHVTLTVVGRKVSDSCTVLDNALAKHHWIPSLSNQDVLKLMQSHDVLAFPSLFEGFGMVITEAMSQGTPVITTDRTAGPDIITHGENGWLVKAGSTDALRQSIEELLSKPEQIISVGNAAMETAKLRPWEVYGRELAEAVIQCGELNIV
ncbi:glycosyltransferase family 4 protein [Catalinimonas sp. 4WD22]|uniref:glycosyltransferase family 4 protein n=1 Tax=Catalinimonas locisalis TaxID=3133978 RepID=UPI0031014B52